MPISIFILLSLPSSKKPLPVGGNDDEDDDGGPISSDDLLPAIILILVKSGIRDLASQFRVMSGLRFSSDAVQGNNNEEAFVLATFEAALEYIKSGRLVQDSVR